MISLHSHSGQFCRHAKGQLEEVVQEAVRQGFKVYGLSEHMPRTRVRDLYPEESDMQPKDTSTSFDNFYKEATRLSALYKSQITLLVGMETEWIHDQTGHELEALLKKYKLDYIVGSVHHVNEHPIDFDFQKFEEAEQISGSKFSDLQISNTEAIFLDYFDAQYEMLKSCKPQVVGHFDLIRMFRNNHPLSPEVWQKLERNIDFIKEYGGLVEINSRAWKKKLPDAYPQRDILKVMMSKGVLFTLSDDSHGPADVGMHYDKLLEYVRSMGIERVHWPGGTILVS